MTGAVPRPWVGRLVVVALLTCLAGCGTSTPDVPAGTGSKEAAQRYFEALAHKDWPEAYKFLAAESKAKVSADRFAKLGEDYRRGLGFDPQSVHINDCEEHGDAAVAHVTLSGKGVHRHRFKDAVTLRNGDAGWVVILPASFGRAGRPPG